MPDTQPTPREELRVPLGLAWGLLGRPLAELDGLLDEYDTARRDQVLTEGAALVLADAEVKYQRSFSDNRIFEFNGGKRARDVLLAARTTTAQEQPR